jgi:hypothetical protein
MWLFLPNIHPNIHPTIAHRLGGGRKSDERNCGVTSLTKARRRNSLTPLRPANAGAIPVARMVLA